ncbi:G1/S-specific cyclin pas1 [Podospora conica]|nr:G1/S-specific cyclin pas1 [Schizothecium conicum]
MPCAAYPYASRYEPADSIGYAPYNLTLVAAASASCDSLCSDDSSQHSDDGNSSVTSSDSDSCESDCSAPSSQSSVGSVRSACEPIAKLVEPSAPQCHQPLHSELPRELRQNPRRSNRSGRPPPTLVRQADRKVNFVENLVDSSTHIVEAIWPTSSVVAHHEQSVSAVLPLRTFIQETLRRSRTSYSTLQVALYYLILIKPHVPKRDFTMEQPDDSHASQAIQCGRRMFLAALILASKYLQDRNYSARAWSRISGLQTQEINQNEMSFLLAVNWKLHITDDMYNRWTECFLKFTPPQPPTPGLAAQQLYDRQAAEFRAAIMTLTPDLDNLDALDAMPSVHETVPRSLFTPTTDGACAFGYDREVAPKQSVHRYVPAVMEPALVPTAPVFGQGRYAPALGLLPTPRLTPQSSGYSTPAASAASYLLSNSRSMSFAMTQASHLATSQSLDRWSPSTSSPQRHFTRRSSLANSISTVSSPESMVSDSSRLSRSSSISSASSVSAPTSRQDALARSRYAKVSERASSKPAFAPVPEDVQFQVECMVASPESYTRQVSYSSWRHPREEEEAAWALHELQTQATTMPIPVPVRAGTKRSRTSTIDNPLQDSVRQLLSTSYSMGNANCSNQFVRGPGDHQIPVLATTHGGNKRLRFSTEAAHPESRSSLHPTLHPAMGGIGGPGMWTGILH